MKCGKDRSVVTLGKKWVNHVQVFVRAYPLLLFSEECCTFSPKESIDEEGIFRNLKQEIAIQL